MQNLNGAFVVANKCTFLMLFKLPLCLIWSGSICFYIIFMLHHLTAVPPAIHLRCGLAFYFDCSPLPKHVLNCGFVPGVAGSKIRDFHCVYYEKEYMECTWDSGPVQPPNSQHYFYYWWALPWECCLHQTIKIFQFHRCSKGCCTVPQGEVRTGWSTSNFAWNYLYLR